VALPLTVIIGDEILETDDGLVLEIASMLPQGATAHEKLVSIPRRNGQAELVLTRREVESLLAAIDRLDASTPARRLDAGRFRDAVVRGTALP
jgi:hypothetical protein